MSVLPEPVARLEQRPLLAAGELLEHGADRGVLVVASRGLAAAIGDDEGSAAGSVRSIPTASSYAARRSSGVGNSAIGRGRGVVMAERRSKSVQRWPFVAITNGTFRRFASAP